MEYSSGSICFDLSELPFLETVKWVVKKHIHKRPPCDGWQPLLRVKPFPAPLPLLEAQLTGCWHKAPQGCCVWRLCPPAAQNRSRPATHTCSRHPTAPSPWQSLPGCWGHPAPLGPSLGSPPGPQGQLRHCCDGWPAWEAKMPLGY